MRESLDKSSSCKRTSTYISNNGNHFQPWKYLLFGLTLFTKTTSGLGDIPLKNKNIGSHSTYNGNDNNIPPVFHDSAHDPQGRKLLDTTWIWNTGDYALHKQGTETQVNTYTASNVAGLSNGGFVITWNSYDQDGSSWGVYD